LTALAILATAAIVTIAYGVTLTIAWALIHGAEKIHRTK
jgi:hypothetical protein